MGYVVFAAKSRHLLDAVDGQPGFCGTGLVVKPGVQNPAIIPGLVLADRRLFFQKRDLGCRILPPKFIRGRQADNTAADNDDALGNQSLFHFSGPFLPDNALRVKPQRSELVQ